MNISDINLEKKIAESKAVSLLNSKIGNIKTVSYEKTVTISPNTDTRIDISSVIPGGYRVIGVKAMLNNYILPYISNGSAVTWLNVYESNAIVIKNLSSTWTNYTIRLVIDLIQS